MKNVINTQKHARIVVIISEQIQKGLIHMNGNNTKETTANSKMHRGVEGSEHTVASTHKAHGSSLSKEDAKTVTKRDMARISVEDRFKRRSEMLAQNKPRRAGANHGEYVSDVSRHDSSSPNNAEQNRTKNAKNIIRESQKAMIHAADMLNARTELGTLNLDYAEADKKMLEQAKKLKHRFG